MTVTNGTITPRDQAQDLPLYWKNIGASVTEQSDQTLVTLDVVGCRQVLVFIDNIDTAEAMDVSIDWSPDSSDSTIWQNITSVDDSPAATAQDYWILSRDYVVTLDTAATPLTYTPKDPHFVLPSGAQAIRIQVQAAHATNHLVSAS